MIDYGLLIGLVSIAVAIFFGLRGFYGEISRKLGEIADKLEKIDRGIEKIDRGIEKHAEHLEKIRDIVVRLDERTEEIFRLSSLKGTKELVFNNLGRVKVTAEPGIEETVYIVEFEKLFVKPRFIRKKALETGLAEEEKKLFGKEVLLTALGPNRMSVHVPSTDPVACSSYISRLLKWLNTEYWEALKELERYEEIE